MSITVNTNLPSLIAQKSLLNATNSMNTALQRMSTGYRINSSKDDATGMAISNKFEYKTSSYKVANDNAQMGQSMLETANGSLSNINSMLQRMRDLTEQAANGTYGDDERNAMQMEINALTEEIYRIKSTTEFNGKNLLGEETTFKSVPTMSMADVSSANWADTKDQVIGISSAEEFLKLTTLINDGNDTADRTFALTSDIDLNDLGDLDGNGSNWIPIETFEHAVFDGNNHTISNLTMNRSTNNTGLFGTTSFAEIKNIQLENVNIDSTGASTGSLIGMSTCTEISNINVLDCNISSTKYNTGGIVGYLLGSTGVLANCNVQGGRITSIQSNIGGAIGLIEFEAKSVNCHSNIDVIGNGFYTGGFVGVIGINCGTEKCSSSGTVECAAYVGGFSGLINPNTIISDCTSYAEVQRCPSNGGTFVGISMDGATYTNCEYETTKNPLNLNPAGTGNGSGIVGKANIPFSQKGFDENNLDVVVLKNDTKCNLQVGIDNDENSVITVDMGLILGKLDVSIMDDKTARNSLDKLDALMEKVSNKMTEIGTVQNRLESVIEAQETQIMTMSSANSLIKDADIAEESSSYIKSQILQQTTASLLATANQCPSIALQLV